MLSALLFAAAVVLCCLFARGRLRPTVRLSARHNPAVGGAPSARSHTAAAAFGAPDERGGEVPPAVPESGSNQDRSCGTPQKNADTLSDKEA